MNKHFLDRLVNYLRLSTKALFDDINLKELVVIVNEDDDYWYDVEKDQIRTTVESDRRGMFQVPIELDLFIIEKLNIDLHTYQCLFSWGDQPDLHPSLPPIDKESSPEDFAQMLVIFKGIA